MSKNMCRIVDGMIYFPKKQLPKKKKVMSSLGVKKTHLREIWFPDFMIIILRVQLILNRIIKNTIAKNTIQWKNI